MLSAAELATLLLSSRASQTLVIDVRQADYSGGKIKGSHHIPFHLLESHLEWLREEARQRETIVFHCHFSQNRGPRAALWLTRHLEGEDSRAVVCVLEGGWGQWRRSHPHLTEPIQ